MSKLLVFDIGSSFGYFRKTFTTTNALTHAIIPRSAIEGLVGAILGLSRNDYPEKLKASKIAIQIMSPVRKLNMQYMHVNPDWWPNISYYLKSKTPSKNLTDIKMSVPASVELLVNPRYRIYLDNPDIDTKLTDYLNDKQAYYTPYLGTSSMICYIKYIDKFEYKSIAYNDSNNYIPVHSVIAFEKRIPKIKLQKDLQFAIEEGLPIHIDNQRKSYGSYKVIYSPEAQFLQVIDKDIFAVNMEGEITNVKFLPTEVALPS
jgi:CRISPR-associated protein Cas5h